MHPFKRLITAITLTLLSIVLLLSALLAYLIVTPLGGRILVRYFKQEFLSVGLMHVGHYEGTLENGFILKDVSIRGLSYLPDALLRIQEVHVHLSFWDLPHYKVDIFNARIFIPDSDPVVFTGQVFGGQIKGSLYGGYVDIHAAVRFWASEDIRRNLQGFIANIDATVLGTLSDPKISGTCLADSIRYKSILLTNVSSRVNVEFLSPMTQVQMNGGVMVDSGLVIVRKVKLQLSQSKFIFNGDALNPMIDIHMGAKVEDMDIHLTIKGASANPELTVTSDPPMAPQQALQVLFTGNAFSSSTSPFNGVTSTQLAENFLDYSLQDVNDGQQFGFKTKLTDYFKVGAEMDQTPLPPGETNTYYSRKVNGEMDMTNHTSLNVSQEVMPQDSYPSYQDAQPEADTQVYVQYKKRF